MSLSNIGKKFLELKQRTTRDYNFNDVLQFRGTGFTVVYQDEYNLEFAVPIKNKNQFKLFVDGKLKSEGVTKDFVFVNIINGVSARIKLNVAPVSVVTIDYELSGIKPAPLPNIMSISAQIENEKNPVGAIIAYASSIIPPGYLLCDGSPVSQTVYASLFSRIGTLYNTGGEPVGTFRVPDLRNEFIRGASTTIALGTAQPDAFKSHTHIQNSHSHTQVSHRHTQYPHNHIQDPHSHIVDVDDQQVAGGSSVTVANDTAGVGDLWPTRNAIATNQEITPPDMSLVAPTINGTVAVNQNTGDAETRPRNKAMHFIIKY